MECRTLTRPWFPSACGAWGRCWSAGRGAATEARASAGGFSTPTGARSIGSPRDRSAAPRQWSYVIGSWARGGRFTLAEHAGKIPHRPRFPSIEVRNTRTGFFEDTEFAAVLQKLRPELRPVAEFALLTGWRRGEVLGLRWRQVDFTVGTVRLEPGSTKNDEARTFPFAALPELAELLQRQRDYTTTIEREAGQIIPWVF